MYELDRTANKLIQIDSKSFQELGFREREHLQEWIADNPECLGEELLIIQKEFNGFNDTKERLDLLALDKNGSIVVIENKIDDTGRDVTWQAMKYVSYCSTLTKQQIKSIYQEYLNRYFLNENAEDKIVEFYDDKAYDEILLNKDDQRIILIAGKFRKEVTSTVMWMLNHDIKIQCFKTMLYKYNDKVLFDIDQIIPVKEVEDYIIVLGEKNRDEKDIKDNISMLSKIRREFWTLLLDKINNYTSLFKNISPSNDHWISSGSGVGGCTFNFVTTKKYASVELYIGKSIKEENKKIYDELYKIKENIENLYGKKLEWERLDDKKTARITEKLNDVDISNRDDWGKILQFFCNAMPKLEKALKDNLINVKKEIYIQER